MANKKKFHKQSECIPSDLTIKSLLCMFNTSDANNIARILLKRKNELEIFIKSNLNTEDLIELLKALFHVYNLKKGRSRSHIIEIIQCEEFVNNLKNCLLNSKSDGNLSEVIDYILHFADTNINELPISVVYYDRFLSLLNILHDVQVDDKFNDTYLWTHELNLLLKQKIIHQNRTNYTWKELSVYPSAIDIFEQKKLTPNNINGAYKNVEEYLDITFTLLKEDYEGQVREGLLQFKSDLRSDTKKGNKYICFYENVNVERVEVNRNPLDGVLHQIAFTSDEKNQKGSSSFLHGSLLFFSIHSKFSTFVLGKMVENVELQESEEEFNKVLKISLIGDPLQLKLYRNYTMIKPNEMFEPYYQVLRALQFKSTINFPMEKYIIKCDNTPCMPSYITVDTQFKIDGQTIKLFSKDSWPSSLFNLDDSQIEALRSALTHELVLIQGAPGTGKSYLAKTIINILIDNNNFLSSPILLMSAANNPVDFILEALVIKSKKVVRLGGQTKSKVLKKYLLNNLMKRAGGNVGSEIKERIASIKESLAEKINQNVSSIQNEVNFFQEERNSYIESYEIEAANRILSTKVEVIGGTTAGCAKLPCMLETLKPEVVIVENANEVLESHVVAALSEGCKHLILIGDQKQLKPVVANKNSAQMYNTDMSLLERMGRRGMKCCTLTMQHRMRPEISSLISPNIYLNMKNHFDTANLPKIKGMKKNMFFIDYEIADNRTKNEDMYSASNLCGGDFLLALANYLVMQGYSSKDITILVPYSSQQNSLINAVQKYPLPLLCGTKILNIDNYSGQENSIVLLSLVMSNSSGIGWLSVTKRMTVALSRAKHGLYIIGDMKTFEQGSNLCAKINSVLRREEAIGKGISLECQTHQRVTVAFKKQDLENMENGGCNSVCQLPLKCGHLCILKCHPLMEQHKTYICREACTRTCANNLHKCIKKCHEECGPCNEVINISPPCGHTTQKKCRNDQSDHGICTEPVVVTWLCCLKRVVPCNEASTFL